MARIRTIQRGTDVGGEERVVLETGREKARRIRREQYQRAKQARDSDPRHAAMKERARQARRDAYQVVKARRKADDAAKKDRARDVRRAALEAARTTSEAARTTRSASSVDGVREQIATILRASTPPAGKPN